MERTTGPDPREDFRTRYDAEFEAQLTIKARIATSNIDRENDREQRLERALKALEAAGFEVEVDNVELDDVEYRDAMADHERVKADLAAGLAPGSRIKGFFDRMNEEFKTLPLNTLRR